MKKIQIIKIFLLILLFLSYIKPTEAQTQETCKWEMGSVGISYTGNTGGCDKATQKKTADSACPQPKPGAAMYTFYECCCSVAQAAPAAPKKPLFVMPVPEVTIPTVKLSSSTCVLNTDNTYACSFPWIGEYINGIYKYGINIAGILAALILMGGGLLWLISGGDASKITQAKDMIIGSITGLMILMSSYILLTQINPDLVKMKSIGMNTINKIILEDADVTVIGGENPYADACLAAKKGDLSICQKYGDNPVQDLGSIEELQANKDVIIKYQAAMECVLNKNNRNLLFAINEAWRSAATQIQYKTTYGSNAATPCCSNHGTGKALDLKRIDGQKMSWSFNDSSGLKDCMNKNGLYANLTSSPDEPWHWSPTGR